MYFNENIDVKRDPATAWKRVNEFLGVNRNQSPTEIVRQNLHGQNEHVNDPSIMATEFNKFFRSKIDNLRNKTDKPPSVCPTQRLKAWLQTDNISTPEFSLKEINRQSFRKIIGHMKGSRVHGVDWIDSFSLKLSAPLIEDSLIHLINLSIKQGSFASIWKPQLIFPLHKKNSKDNMTNYRPICHLVQIGKLVEIAVKDQIIEHFQGITSSTLTTMGD